MKQAVIDRFEGDVAVCEDCETGLVNLNLPEGAKEGDCLNLFADGVITVDTERTRVTRQRVLELMHRAFSDPK
mgnify:FL=1